MDAQSKANKGASGSEESRDMHAFSGVVEEVDLADLIQMTCLQGQDRELVVTKGEKTGKIYISKGEVVDAQLDGIHGEEAFFRILVWSHGSFKLRKTTAPPQTISTPWNFLVMEALRKQDEGVLGDEKSSKVRVLVVDDSAFFAKALKKALEEDGKVEVVGIAENGKMAIELISKSNPDFLTLDINMPVMAGDAVLKNIMIRSPAPVLVISGLSDATLPKAMEFLRLGAVDFVPKPSVDQEWPGVLIRIKRHVENAKKYNLRNIRRARLFPASRKTNLEKPASRLLLVIAGPGGLLEIQKILPAFGQLEDWSVVISLDIDRRFLSHLIKYTDKICEMSVCAPASKIKLRAAQVCMCTWQDVWEVKQDGGQNFLEFEEIAPLNAQTNEDECAERLNRAIRSASDIFGAKMAMCVMTGTDLDLDEGVQEVVIKAGHFFLQKTESALFSAPLLKLGALEYEEALIESDALVSHLKRLEEK